ncbi:amino acid-binding protein [Desulfoluna limicola]|uniref:Amino acid-binding protein n=2 Tax=Desulfoluna limicola TaxID=2810562 RepID=A0ABM7PI40_9BACT|nr:amino acid-binding protein [Desulfoluna limicola]
MWYRLMGIVSLAVLCVTGGEANAGEGRETGNSPRRAPILIGLDADLSSGSAESGLAIRRGIELALDEINAGGGVLGRPLGLVVRDHHGNPTRGIDNIIELSGMPDLVAVVGGLHTPVAMAELPAIHKHRVIYLGPWAAGTPVVDNGYSPNFVFRISVRDSLAGGYLIDQALARGFKHPALLLENTGWGRSNEKAMNTALSHHGMAPTTTQWLNWGAKKVSDQLQAVEASGADVVMLVTNAPEGAVVIKTLADLPEERRMPVISHWGITGGSFFQDTRDVLPKTDLMFLQTFSFLATASEPRSATVAEAYITRYDDCDTLAHIKSPVGTAHAYDLVHLLARAIRIAGSTDRSRVRDALEQIQHHPGLVRNYAPPFTPTRHDALTRADFHLARFDENGVIRRITP